VFPRAKEARVFADDLLTRIARLNFEGLVDVLDGAVRIRDYHAVAGVLVSDLAELLTLLICRNRLLTKTQKRLELLLESMLGDWHIDQPIDGIPQLRMLVLKAVANLPVS